MSDQPFPASEREAAEKACEEATPEPWIVDCYPSGDTSWFIKQPAADYRIIAEYDGECTFGEPHHPKDDYAFMGVARTALPKALAALEAAETKLKVLEGTTDHPENKCERCGGRNIVWSGDNDTWNWAAGKYSVLCPICFAELVEELSPTPRIWRLLCDLDETRERSGHAGDCEFYASVVNGEPTDGICTCGYGQHCWDNGDYSQMVSEERREADKATKEQEKYARLLSARVHELESKYEAKENADG